MEQMSIFTNQQTLESARDELRGKLEQGSTCPCCGQFAKLYRRKIHASMAMSLIALYRLSTDGREWIDILDVADMVHQLKTVNATADFAKLAYWGMIEAKTNDDESRRTSGMWRITDNGRRYVERRSGALRYALVYNGELQGFDGGLAGIDEALGSRFNYSELMEL